MNEIVQQLAKHGYAAIFASVLARQLCLPIPAILVLLAAGSLAGNGQLNIELVVGLGVIGCVLADLVWFEAGRLRGNAILHFILRFSSKPESNAARAKHLFTRHGAKILLIAKFVMGLDEVAPPLAGMSGTSRLRFMFFDAVGATLWAGLYTGLGYVFCAQLEKAVTYAGKMGELLTAIVLLVVAVLVDLPPVLDYSRVDHGNRRRNIPRSLGLSEQPTTLLCRTAVFLLFLSRDNDQRQHAHLLNPGTRPRGRRPLGSDCYVADL